MMCPVCKVELRLAERQGVEIDYCPQCRGIWLDRGELDKILEREATGRPVYPTEPAVMANQPYRAEYSHDDDDYEDYRYKKPNRYEARGKRKSFLGDIFDFD